MVVDQETRAGIGSLPPLELLRTHERFQRDETIPLASISLDLSIVDDSHANELGDSMTMAGGRKQISRIVVRAREEEGEILYDIIDGFHRVEGARRRNMDMINAVVMYGCDDAEMFDLRILAASSVKSVQYARIAEWMTRAFELTPWKRKGLTVVQAFSLAVTNRETTYKGLSPEELKDLKDWVKEKCEDRWGRNIASTYAILRVVANADPNLVAQVRPSGGGAKDHAGRITPARLAAVALTMPGNYEAQNAVLQYAVDKRLSAIETENLAKQVALAITSGEGGVNYELLIQDLVEAHTRIPVEQEDLEPEITDLMDAEEEDVDPEIMPLPATPRKRIAHLVERGADLTPEASSRDVADLRRALRIAHEQISSGEENDYGWWRTAPYLAPEERDILTDFFDGEGFDLTRIAIRHRITQIQVLNFVRSAILKHYLKVTPKETASGEVEEE
ncbi:hypothetical protein A2165_02220 [Candidatus Curtissbacteria bacterium RBG_13_40_7]|uniref:ParB/Sulfiredoxin domain-containing protein n=1 Tax=Candidatus Curtissbacteria bacterium RBG_13_40_7 TaxID=1797706 RepID=A0A1F5FYB5_9BACT|nr:MAG: hypothetical protein A2165_02220 [Candidatus Curtissbacteria bacterium RBG_13_40_7]